MGAERGSEREVAPMNSSELMDVLTNTTQAAQSLIVCRGAKVCRGEWTWHGGARVCRGGFYCRDGVALLAEGTEGDDQVETTFASADLAERSWERRGELMNSSEMDVLTNTSQAAQSLIICRGARVCRGAWTWRGGAKVCRGGFYCRGGVALLAEDVEGDDQAETTSAMADLAERGSEREVAPMKSSELAEI